MQDKRHKDLSDLIVNYSCEVKKGDHVLIDLFDDGIEMGTDLIKAVYEAGGYPHVRTINQRLQRALLFGTSNDHMEMWGKHAVNQMKDMDCYIGIRGSSNVGELSDVPSENMQLYMTEYNHKVHSEIRVKKTRWVVLRYPNGSMAQLANMSTEAFEDFYFSVCNVDYKQMSENMNPLIELMNKTDKVHILGPNTDLRFSIKDIPTIKCAGKRNIPDGEVFTAPVKDSVNGYITFNTPTVYSGNSFENIYLEFENGKIIKATSNDNKKLNEILDTDDGARYIGEFAIGVNHNVKHPIKDILFDEKIGGSFHFTPGQAYEEAYNDNDSSIHWDLVSIQRNDYGGGEIYFDGVLIRKDGVFTLPELQDLNSK